MTIRLPSSLGSLWVLTEGTAGTYLAPTLGAGATPALSAIKSGPEPAIEGQGILRNEDDVVPIGGGGDPTLGDLMMGWGTLEISASAFKRASSVNTADWLPLLRSCALTETVVTAGLADPTTDATIRFAPAIAPSIPPANNQSPRVCSWTWRDAGASAIAQVWRSRAVVSRIASISSGSDGDIRIAFEALGLWYRATNVADAITTAAEISLTGAPTYFDRAEYPLFRLSGVDVAVDGGTLDTAKLLEGVCLHDFSFDPGMTLEAQPCLGEVDGYAPAFSYQTGQAVLSMQVSVPEEDGTSEAVIYAMLNELQGDELALEWTRVSGTVTWKFQLRIKGFRVLSVARGDNAGARTYQVELCGRPDPATSDPGWDLIWSRVEV